MPSFFTDNDDLLYYFDRGIDWDALAEITEFGFRTEGGPKSGAEAKAFYREVAEMVGTFVAEEIAPHAAEIDREGVRFEHGEAVFPKRLASIFDKVKALELHGMNLPRELGGQNCPLLLYLVNAEMMARADVSVMAHHSFHGGMAMAMLAFSILEGTTSVDAEKARILETRWAGPIAEIARGDAWGCMDITEPGAGSDMAAIRSKGELDEHGVWRVSGQKIFITSGHAKYHFVIARTEKAAESDDPLAGLGGLSMFLVPAYSDTPSGRQRTVTIDRIEEKLGHHGSVTAALSFDRAKAELVGRRGEGFKYMLTLMNNARLGVGFESIGLCEAAYRAASAYAGERRSMGKPIGRHEMIFDALAEMRSDIEAIRALAMYGGFHEEMANKITIASQFASMMTPDERARMERDLPVHKAASRRTTPLLKYFAAEKAVEMARRCVQIHGGNGYTRDYPGEKLLRDAMVMPIYEGTSQIQALMAMKDTLGGIVKAPQTFVRRLAEARLKERTAKDVLVRRVARIASLSLDAQRHLVTRTAVDKLRKLPGKPVSTWKREIGSRWDPKRDFALAMLHAERLTRLLVDEAVSEILLEQALVHDERREVLERFLDRAELRSRHLHEEITTTGARTLAALAATPGGEA